MKTRTKLIIFFSVIAVVIFSLGILWALRSSSAVNASAEAAPASEINPTAIALLLDDHLDSVSPGSISTYSLKIYNRSQQDLGNLRVYGYIGLPTKSESDLLQNILPGWLLPENFHKYSADHYFNFVINLRAQSWAKAKIPVEIQKYSTDQDKVFAKAYLQLITGKLSNWNIFRLQKGYSGPILAIREETTNLQ